MRIPPRSPAGAAVVTAAVLALAAPAVADGRRSTTTSSTTTTTSSTTSTSSSTTSTSSTTTTTEAPPSTTTTTTTTTAPAPEPTTTTLAPGQVPPGVQAMIDAYPRTPAGTTADLVAALAALPPGAAQAGFGRFPVAGLATWTHDWLFPRHVPAFHVHQGIDLFADRGTPVLAPAAGTVRVTDGAIGGLAVTIVQPDRTTWYLAHLDSVAVSGGQEVTAGSVIGTVGSSGNAVGGPPHVHLEVRPLGGDVLDPKGLVDLMYAEALAAAADLVDAYTARALLTADALEVWLGARNPTSIIVSWAG
ncbi:MAG TPA: M23 family metallopeptidase [Acidimicrobiales bacterium]|nr:M23 family metallopeptidase [Acidimicrobiales bacterium]